MPTYQELVSAQIKRYNGGKNSSIPLTHGIFYLDKREEEKPLWGLAFSEKPVPVDKNNQHTIVITDEKVLVELKIPRQYEAVEIEREIILDHQGHEALVERVYYRYKPDFGKGREIISATTLIRDYGYRNEFQHRLILSTQTPEHYWFSGDDYLNGQEEVHSFFEYPTPLSEMKVPETE